MIRSFERYLKNKDHDPIINTVKNEILLMLYNNRLIENIEQLELLDKNEND